MATPLGHTLPTGDTITNSGGVPAAGVRVKAWVWDVEGVLVVAIGDGSRVGGEGLVVGHLAIQLWGVVKTIIMGVV